MIFKRWEEDESQFLNFLIWGEPIFKFYTFKMGKGMGAFGPIKIFPKEDFFPIQFEQLGQGGGIAGTTWWLFL